MRVVPEWLIEAMIVFWRVAFAVISVPFWVGSWKVWTEEPTWPIPARLVVCLIGLAMAGVLTGVATGLIDGVWFPDSPGLY